MGKLANLKNSGKKIQDVDTNYEVPDDYSSEGGSTEHSSSSQESGEWAEVVQETCALHPKGTVSGLCKKRRIPDQDDWEGKVSGKRGKTML